MDKEYYVIESAKGDLIKKNGKVMFFEYPAQAQREIDILGSQYLHFRKWKK